MSEAGLIRFDDVSIALVMSGGNALGAYQAGAYQALDERGVMPDWVAGASAGAINGAIICGNEPDRRLAKLAALWRPADVDDYDSGRWAAPDALRRTHAAAATLATGQAGLFVPRSIYGAWWNPFGNPEPASLYDSSPLEATLEQLVDFDRLNQGAPRFCATAVDIETGEDICVDTRTRRIAAAHVRASAALIPAFSPVEIEGRLVGDAGISVNLPLDVVLSEPHECPLLCIALDLLPLRAPRPRSLGDTVSRMQDLLFATQSRRAIAAWQALFAERARHGDIASVTILHIAYQDQSREVSGKAFDFSPASAAARWRAGYRDLAAALDEIAGGGVKFGRPGMAVFRQNGQRHLEEVHWQLGPTAV